MNILSIGGSDPSSGAGIQSDVKAFAEFGIYGLTVITAITSQNTSSFGVIEPVSKTILKNQMESVFADFKIDGIKIGMVFNSEIIKTLYQLLKKSKVPIIVDPVIKSTTGGALIEKNAINDFQKYIIPLATVITPNKFEAEILAKKKVNSKNSIEKIAKIIQKMGATNVVITGIKRKNKKIEDFVLEKNTKYIISGNMVSSTNHGSGCNYSAAMAFTISNKKTIRESVKFAKEFAYNSIKNENKKHL
jgi:hydroxymethylpyrimidine/phosphomethylpyrimidine kinase